MGPSPIDISPALQAQIEAAGLEFMARFLEVALERRPDWHEALVELGQLYTQLGRYLEGLAVDERLVRLFPKNHTVHYNLACSLALLGRKDAALDALERAVELGYRDREHLLQDGDLAGLLGDPRFERLLAQLSAYQP